MLKKVLLSAVCLVSVAASAINIADNGLVEAAGIKVAVNAVNRKWAWCSNGKLKNIKQEKSDNKRTITGTAKLQNSAVTSSQTFTKEADGWYTVDSKFTFEPAMNMARCGYIIAVDTAKTKVEIDGKKINFGPEDKRKMLFYRKAKKVLVNVREGESLEIAALDNVVFVERTKNGAQLVILFPDSSKDAVTESSASVKMRPVKSAE